MKFRYLMGLIPLLTMPAVASASDYGCEALLCFAGGKNVSECQPTIKKVLKDLSRGKSFPSCAMQGDSSNPINVVVHKKRGKVRSVEMYIDPAYASDKEHQYQRFTF
ncbi:hypothetical protein [Acinetobacter calcoaceticus]|uniref:hypothetical protein n=1 Tax=Acinetobacter calcoaceticus TaxID=471 RepID=UPI00124C45F3|nr:hypothetical protein [Acinetobacter calcoaceticus]